MLTVSLSYWSNGERNGAGLIPGSFPSAKFYKLGVERGRKGDCIAT